MHKIYTFAYVHTPISICVFRHRHTIYTEAEAPTSVSPPPPTSEIQNILISFAGQDQDLWKKKEQFSPMCRHRGCSHRDDRVWHMGVAKWCSAYSISSVPNVLFNNLWEDESLLLFFNTKHACHFSTAISLKVLLTAGTITAISHFATCLSVRSHNSWGTATFPRFAVLLWFSLPFLSATFSCLFYLFIYSAIFISFPFCL